MKKAIGITIGIVLGTTSIIGAGVFLPVLFTANSPSTIIVNSADAFYSPNTKASNATLKEALLGTKKINNGNYVVYFGSEGIDSNFNFLYKVNNNTSVDQLQMEQASNKKSNLSGNYWTAINYVLNSSESSKNIKDKPQFLAYVNTIGAQTRLNNQKLANEATECLKFVLKYKDNYNIINKSSNEYKKINQKFDFLTRVVTKGIISNYLKNGINEFYQNLNQPFEGNSGKNVYESINWVIYPQHTNFDPSPFATYENSENKNTYYNDDSLSKEFRDIWDFIKTYPLFKNVKEIATSDGVVVGYRNGAITDIYSGSFDTPSEGDNGSGGEGSNTPDGGTPPAPTTYNIDYKNLSTSGTITEPTGNAFYDWIKNVFGITVS